MSSLYAMRRANGDWFALDDHGRLRVPVFRNDRAAMAARSRHWGMLLFKPVLLDERALRRVSPRKTVKARRALCLVDDLLSVLRPRTIGWSTRSLRYSSATRSRAPATIKRAVGTKHRERVVERDGINRGRTHGFYREKGERAIDNLLGSGSQILELERRQNGKVIVFERTYGSFLYSVIKVQLDGSGEVVEHQQRRGFGGAQ